MPRSTGPSDRRRAARASGVTQGPSSRRRSTPGSGPGSKPGALAPEAEAALLQPVRGGDGTVLGFLALAGLGGDPAAPRLVAALDDAAAIALPFVAAARARRAGGGRAAGRGAAPIRDAVLPAPRRID